MSLTTFFCLMYVVVGLFWAIMFKIRAINLVHPDKETDAAIMVIAWPLIIGALIALGVLRMIGKAACGIATWLNDICRSANTQ
jgi:hypothetical protein